MINYVYIFVNWVILVKKKKEKKKRKLFGVDNDFGKNLVIGRSFLVVLNSFIY